MDFAAIRSRLAGSDGRLYWRSLSELADTSDFRDYLHREFPEQASEWNDPKGRRNFLKLMSASLALAGVGACTRQPPENIVPYVRQPEDLVPGRPLFFASAIPLGGVARPVLVESHMGRPTKIEGNPEHPASLGATDSLTQAAVLGLYDPDRAQTVTYRGEVRPWSAYQNTMQSALTAQKATQGAGLRILSEPITSPSLSELVATVLQDYPQATWHQYDPVATDGGRLGLRQATGAPSDAVYHLDKAEVVVSLDADFLGFGPSMVRYTRDFADRRRVTDDSKQMNRLYVIESSPTLTGAKAEHRLPIRSSDIEGFARTLGAAVGVGGQAGAAGGPAASNEAKWVAAIAKDLQAHRGRSVVMAGEFQPAAVHALAHAINQALGNVGTTVTYGGSIEPRPISQHASLFELSAAMDAGHVQLLLILGNNPAFTAPADVKFVERLAKVGLVIYHSLYQDETSEFAHWNIPETHPLETWGDPRAYDGTVTLMQPLIAPLYDAHSAHEVIAELTSQRGKKTLDLVKDYWTRAFGGATGWTIRNADGESFANGDAFWKQAVHDGFIRGTATATGGQATPFKPVPAALAAAATAALGAAAAPVAAPATPAVAAAPSAPTPLAPPPAAGGLELVFRPDPMVWDGRFANNGWLQEAPKPLTKLTWDTAAWISPKLAQEKDLDNGDIIELKYRGASTRMPVFIVPGQPDQSVTVFLGYGRRMAGRVGTASEEAQAFNAYRIRTSDAPWFGTGLEIVKTGDRYLLATTQDHHAMEGRHPARVVTLAEYTARPGSRLAHGPCVPQDAHALPGPRVHGQQVGHGHRPVVLHRVRRVRRRVRGREQHPGRRQGAGQRRSRDALDPRRPLLHRRDRHAGVRAGGPPACSVSTVRERAVRGRLPGRRDHPQLGGSERHDLQPLRGHALLLEQLPLQSAPLQLHALLGLEYRELLPAAQSRRQRPQPRRDGEVHLLRAAHQPRAHRRQEGQQPGDSRRRDRHRLRGRLPGRCDRVREPERPEQPRQQAEGAAAQLRHARRFEYAPADDLPGVAAQHQS